jgi:predicted dehydrogenase
MAENEDVCFRKKLKTVVIGLGRIAWSKHIPDILKHEGFELTGIVDPIAERVEETKTKFGIENGYLSCDELFSAQKPDLVVVASPTKFHLEQTLQAFSNGCDVFCDKPIAGSLQEADAMIAAMKNSGRKLMVFQPRRMDVELSIAKTILDSGKLGKVYMIKRAVSGFVRRNDWQAFKEYGGGMLNNYGAHYIDQMVCLLNENIAEAMCELRSIASLGDADDVVKAVLKTESGILLDIDINQACPVPFVPWYIMGECGSAFYDQNKNCWHLKYYIPDEVGELEVQTGLAAEGRQYIAESIPWHEEEIFSKDFEEGCFYDKCYEYFALEQEPFVPVTHTREVMRVIAECRKSAEG